MTPKTKEQVQVEQQIIYNFAQVVEAFPQYSTAQHICHFLRRKSEAKDVYFWSDELLLLKIEQYYAELKNDLSLPNDDNDY